MKLDIKRICPYCGHTLDGVIETNGCDENPPRAGDYTVCFGCLGLLKFTKESFKKLKLESIKNKSARNELINAIRNIEKFKAEISYLN